MQTPPIPEHEQERLDALHTLSIMDTSSEERFDVLTKEVTEKLHAPISTISLIDKDREWFKSCVGLENIEGPRDISFCGHALIANHMYIVEDTLRDPLFKDNPYVTGPPYIRFYAGVQLHEAETHLPIGVFCVKDTKPRNMSMEEMDVLMEYAKKAEEEINKSSTSSS